MFPSSEELLAMAQRSSVGILLHEVSSLRILWANRRACEQFQYSVAELRSLKAHHMSSQDPRHRREDGVAWLHSAALYGTSQRQWKYQAADGTDFLTDATATLVPFDGRRVIMVEFRVLGEAEVEPQSPEWISTSLERLMTHTASGVLVLDTENRVERASPLAAGLFGLNSVEIVGEWLADLGDSDPPLDSPAVMEPMSQEDGNVNTRMRVGDGNRSARWLACFLENITIEGERYRVLTARDITDRVEAENLNAAQKTQLQYLSRYNAMGDMAMILAHDLGQPLAASLNYLSGLKARSSSAQFGPEMVHYGIEKVEKQLQRASEIVASAKRYVRRIESTVSTISLLETVEESLYFVRLRAQEKGVEVVTDLGTEPLNMEGEGVLIGQVIINLCMNAIDEISRPETTVKELHLKLSEYGGLASLAIGDQGRGMDTIPADRLAAGAFSSKEDGAGIGLIISEHIAQRHGGHITFAPNEPKGTIATLSLPLESAVAATTETAGESAGSAATEVC